MRWLAKFIFWFKGWKIVGTAPIEKKFVMIAAPHTSNWDFVYARGAFFLLGIPLKYTVKKELFFFPLSLLLKSLGGISIDRKAKGNMVQNMIDLYNDNEHLAILITPEGTRSYSPEWKKGFYYIAKGAELPIYLGFLDYKKKEAGIGPRIIPGDNYEKDLEEIQSFYRGITAKYPEKGVR